MSPLERGLKFSINWRNAIILICSLSLIGLSDININIRSISKMINYKAKKKMCVSGYVKFYTGKVGRKIYLFC